MPRALPAEERRGEILDGAFALFAEHGYHALSTRDLARHLGATTGVLYHWFDSKEALFEAMLGRQVERQVGEALDALGGVPLEGRMAALGRHIAARGDDLQRTLLVSLDYQRAHPGAAPLARALAAYRGALAGDVGLSEDAARVVIDIVLGELLQRILDPTRSLEPLARLLPAVGRPAAQG